MTVNMKYSGRSLHRRHQSAIETIHTIQHDDDDDSDGEDQSDPEKEDVHIKKDDDDDDYDDDKKFGGDLTTTTTIINNNRQNHVLIDLVTRPLTYDCIGGDYATVALKRRLRPRVSTVQLGEIWNMYKAFARQYHAQVDVADDLISRILFWLPHRAPSSSLSPSSLEAATDDGGVDKINPSTSSYWREVIYGLLSLHRLVLSLALQQPSSTTMTESLSGYGMTIQTRDRPCVPAVPVRIALTVIQSILPSVLAIAGAFVTTSERRELHEQGQSKIAMLSPMYCCIKRTTRVRLYIEQCRFVLRMYLLCNYWNQQQQEQKLSSSQFQSLSPSSFGGIMIDGGLFHADPISVQQGMPWEQADAVARREAYVGRRTGWRQNKTNMSNDDLSCGEPASKISSRILSVPSFLRRKSFQIKLAEVLHVSRPMLWAWFENLYPLATLDSATLPLSSKNSSEMPSPSQSEVLISAGRVARRRLLQAWALCLGIDIASISMLLGTIKKNHRRRRSCGSITNDDYIYEINRRKMALLLYGLRCPLWNTVTSPVLLDRTASAWLQRIPLVGRLLDTALWDWVMYYKWLALEEG